jgi:hypothetical protein
MVRPLRHAKNGTDRYQENLGTLGVMHLLSAQTVSKLKLICRWLFWQQKCDLGRRNRSMTPLFFTANLRLEIRRAAYKRSDSNNAIKRPSGPHCLHQRFNAQYFHDPLEIVGQYMQAHFRANPL